jgi:tRNA A-37 threonylcarbamoyl transferase component Bud32
MKSKPDDTVFLNKASATPTTGAAGSSSVVLSPELLSEASRRLGWAGLVYASAYFLAYWGPYLVTSIQSGDPGYLVVQNWTAAIAIALGIAVFAMSRVARLRPETFLDFGLIFGVVGSCGIAVAQFAEGFTPGIVSGRYLGIPWECVWIIIFPLVAPNRPRRVLIASLVSASASPITVIVMHRYFAAPVNAPVTVIVTYFAFSSYLCAILAFVLSRIVHRYSVRLRKAREIGAYELVAELGRGGMGEVWVARHRLLARPAAVKLIRPELLGADLQSQETVSRRFEREARATAELRSTHTVDIYDFGRSDDGAFFYVMELLDGVSLDAMVKQHGPINSARAIFLLQQVCHSLGEAHEHGLIHRDIKPANIFVCRLGPDFDFVKVLDFGLVKRDGGIEADTLLTAQDATAGTPAYMAPEMATDRGTVDGRADLYAVGCVAYWMLTGRQVFEGESAIATILKHVRERAPRPSEHSELPIPPELDQLVLDCLSKDPNARPQTAAELAMRLAAIPVAAPWSVDDGREWWRLHGPAKVRSN